MTMNSVMIVEDNHDLAAQIQKLVSKLGYQVASSHDSGEAAVEQLETEVPDLVLMDIMLAGEMNGVTAARRIRERADVPVVFLTSCSDSDTLKEVSEFESHGFVLKPFDEAILAAAMELALLRHSFGRKGESDKARPQSPKAEYLSSAESKAAEVISRTAPMSSLKRADQIQLARHSRFAEFRTGEFLAMEGDRDVPGFIVVEGRVALIKTSIDGRELAVETLPPGDAFGVLVALRSSEFQFNLRARCAGTLLWLPTADLRKLLTAQSKFDDGFVRVLAAHLDSSYNLSRQLAHDSVELRLAKTLRTLTAENSESPEKPNGYRLYMTRAELATIVGTSPETVTRILRRWELSGLVECKRGLVIIHADLSPEQLNIFD